MRKILISINMLLLVVGVGGVTLAYALEGAVSTADPTFREDVKIMRNPQLQPLDADACRDVLQHSLETLALFPGAFRRVDIVLDAASALYIVESIVTILLESRMRPGSSPV